jgi:hypothetical protein
MKCTGYQLIITSTLVFYMGCGNDSTSEQSAAPLQSLTSYTGFWQSQCPERTPTQIKQMYIDSTGRMWTVDETYADVEACNDSGADPELAQIVQSTIRQISPNENNNDYDSIFLNNSESIVIPKTSEQATNFSTNEQCGQDQWSADSPQSFNSENVGEDSNGNTCWQESAMFAGQLVNDDNQLNYNGRAGFDGEDGEDIVFTHIWGKDPLSGTVGGSPWLGLTARAQPSNVTEGELALRITFDHAVDPCADFVSDASRGLIMEIPQSTGDYSLNSDRTATLFKGSTNHIASSGSLTIEEITENQVTAKLNINYDSENNISGWFKATLCEN